MGGRTPETRQDEALMSVVSPPGDAARPSPWHSSLAFPEAGHLLGVSAPISALVPLFVDSRARAAVTAGGRGSRQAWCGTRRGEGMCLGMQGRTRCSESEIKLFSS